MKLSRDWPDKINPVYVHTPGGKAGTLSFERGSYTFSYNVGSSEDISLTMAATGRVVQQRRTASGIPDEHSRRLCSAKADGKTEALCKS